ncbi:C40 family peptidase [Brevibacillus sp. B_LB10_24]|uniref:C40 family peptidase n=1 Tax=Brevibacillus sp. B_LB10_24 TaxID=3380645 RepID=UPI0038B80019
MNANLLKITKLLLTILIAGGLSACNDDNRPRTKGYDGSRTPGADHVAPLRINQAADTPEWKKTADSIIADGLRYWGKPYVYGTPRFEDKAFDCSSYVQYLYARHGIPLGYHAREQAVQGVEVPFINMRKGDIMFFSDEDFPNETGLNKVRHVGIYMGDGQILHTYEPGTGVIISNIHKDEKEGEYWYEHFLFARRVIPDKPDRTPAKSSS